MPVSRLVSLPLLAALAACVTTTTDIAERNREALSELEIGMGVAVAEATMGTNRWEVTDQPFRVPNPYRVQTLPSADRRDVRVSWYVTGTEEDGDLTLTPLVFVDGKLSGWGDAHLHAVRTGIEATEDDEVTLRGVQSDR